MIPTIDEITRGVVGASLLLRNDARGLAAFDVSLEGFVKSFSAAVLMLPAFAFVHWLQTRDAAFGATPLGLALLAYALQWVAFPVTAALLAKLMQRTQLFVPYVVAANWAYIVQIGIVVPVALLGTLLPTVVADLLAFALVLGLLVYDYQIARFAFQAEGFEGVGVVLAQLLVGLLIHHLVVGG